MTSERPGHVFLNRVGNVRWVSVLDDTSWFELRWWGCRAWRSRTRSPGRHLRNRFPTIAEPKAAASSEPELVLERGSPPVFGPSSG